jgi:hypothetical protein
MHNFDKLLDGLDLNELATLYAKVTARWARQSVAIITNAPLTCATCGALWMDGHTCGTYRTMKAFDGVERICK